MDDVEDLGVGGRGLGVWRRRGPLVWRVSVRAAAGDDIMMCVAVVGVEGYVRWGWGLDDWGRGGLEGEAEEGEEGVKEGAYLRQSVTLWSVYSAVLHLRLCAVLQFRVCVQCYTLEYV